MVVDTHKVRDVQVRYYMKELVNTEQVHIEAVDYWLRGMLYMFPAQKERVMQMPYLARETGLKPVMLLVHRLRIQKFVQLILDQQELNQKGACN